MGASAGGVEALQELVAWLPRKLAAALLVVMHMPPYRNSFLPQILSRIGQLPASHPESGERIEHGRIYVAPPDLHLMVDDNRVRLWRGPKENRFRPAIDTLFRSAAREWKERVIGVILTGRLDDGSLGLWWVKHCGGIAIVQHPEEAAFNEMPRNALSQVQPDYVASVREIGRLLVELTGGEGASPPPAVGTRDQPRWKPKNS